MLDAVLSKVNLSYRIEQGVNIVPGEVKEGEKEVHCGSVTDEKKHPLPGVTVIVKGLTLGTSTDVKGRFSLTLPKMQNVSLLFSFIGMETQEVQYTGQDSLHVVLKESAEQLEEVVVRTGYQNIDKRKLTSAVQTIRMDDIKVSGVNTIDQMLEGRIPGMIFMQNSGQVGAPEIKNTRNFDRFG
ncbi:MAG: carboxypeptidase-like regulatory domain-containing protein [Butyricimonas faecihominis]